MFSRTPDFTGICGVVKNRPSTCGILPNCPYQTRHNCDFRKRHIRPLAIILRLPVTGFNASIARQAPQARQ